MESEKKPFIIRRQAYDIIKADLKDRMVFLGGPRQVGKTFLAKLFLPNKEIGYYNYDILADRTKILNQDLDTNLTFIVLDEVHKYKFWRQLVKGIFDKYHDRLKIIVTGSARLDHFRKGGDSLFGRYHYHRLHPFTLQEVLTIGPEEKPTILLNRLLEFSGFPEPFIRRNKAFLKRWHLERRYKVIHDDLRDLQHVKEISQLELLAELLPSKVSSPLSVASLSEDLATSPKTIESWITILENLYFCFRLLPFGAPKIRAVKKEKKLYLWDWSELSDGARLENFIAVQLLIFCHKLEDQYGEKMELRFLRDTDKREIDFVVLQNKKPLFAVECKSNSKSISPWLHYFGERATIPLFYQLNLSDMIKNQQNFKSGIKSYTICTISIVEFLMTELNIENYISS